MIKCIISPHCLNLKLVFRSNFDAAIWYIIIPRLSLLIDGA
jgi:hypothetical protein